MIQKAKYLLHLRLCCPVPDVVLTHCRLLMAMYDDIEEVSIEKLRGTGFTVQSPTGLRSMLMNPFNGGMLVYKGVLLNSKDHEHATDLGTFLYAFNHLSPTNLDGTPKKREIAQRQRELEQIDRDILATQAAMQRIEVQVDTGELTNPTLAKKANKRYGQLEQELVRLEGNTAF